MGVPACAGTTVCPFRGDDSMECAVPWTGLSIQLRDHREPRDPARLEGLEERAVILERHAAVRLAVRPEHIRVREQAGAVEDRRLAGDRSEPDRLDAVEQALAHLHG